MIQSKNLYKHFMFALTVIGTVVVTILSYTLVDGIENFLLKKYFLKNCNYIVQHTQEINSIVDYLMLFNIIFFVLFFLLFVVFLTKYLRHLNVHNIFFTVTALTLFNSIIIAAFIYTKQFNLTTTIDICTYIKTYKTKIREYNNTTNQL